MEVPQTQIEVMTSFVGIPNVNIMAARMHGCRARRRKYQETLARARAHRWQSKHLDHDYVSVCRDARGDREEMVFGKKILQNGWRLGRQIVEWETLLSNLRYCEQCRLGPVPLTLDNVVGEMQCGLGGYLYVRCVNPSCQFVNRAAYGKVHRQASKKKTGMPCFVINTKLGAGE